MIRQTGIVNTTVKQFERLIFKDQLDVLTVYLHENDSMYYVPRSIQLHHRRTEISCAPRAVYD
jgi:hypothetical protein